MSIERIFKPHIVKSGGYKGGKSAAELSKGQKIYKLSSNENTLGSALQEDPAFKNHKLNIYPSPTPQSLYQALAEFYNHELEADQFVAGNGGSDILQMLCMAFLDTDTNCIISNPCFGPYKMFSEWMGADVVDVPLLTPDYTLDISGILSAINPQTRIIFLTSPNNPTGTYITKSQLSVLVAKVPDHILLVYDEVYYQYADRGDYTIGLSFVKEGAHLLAINSFSKAYGMAGLRLGYAYTTPTIASYLRKVLRPFLINSIGLVGGIEALKNQSFIDRTKSTIIAERRYLQEELHRLKIQHWDSQGNFILIKTELDEQVLTQSMQDHHIMVRPAGNFGAPGCVRMTIGNRESSDACLQALATILKK